MSLLQPIAQEDEEAILGFVSDVTVGFAHLARAGKEGLFFYNSTVEYQVEIGKCFPYRPLLNVLQ